MGARSLAALGRAAPGRACKRLCPLPKPRCPVDGLPAQLASRGTGPLRPVCRTVCAALLCACVAAPPRAGPAFAGMPACMWPELRRG